MHPAARWGGRRAEIDIAGRGCILPPCRAKQELPQIHRSSADVSAYKISVHAFQRCRSEHPPRQNAIAESRRETLDLRLQAVQHVELRTVGHMAISPCGMFPLRSARRVEQTGLRQQNKWALGMVSMPHGFLRRSNLLQSASQMYGCGAQAFGGPPRNRARQGVVNFEDAGAVTILLQLTPVRGRQ